MGHLVRSLPTAPFIHVISRHAWRVPKSVTQLELAEYIGVVLKQARALEHVDDQAAGSYKGSAVTDDKKPVKRKRASKKKAGGVGVPVGAVDTSADTEGHSDSGTVKTVKEDGDVGC